MGTDLAEVAATARAAVARGAGLLAMLPKAWADPGSETLATYALAGVTGLLAVVAVADWEPNLLLFPVNYCVGNSATAAVIALRRRAGRDAAGTRVFRLARQVSLPAPGVPHR